MTFRWLVGACLIAASTAAQDRPGTPPKILPTALLPFQERGEGAKGLAAQVGDLLFASLAAEPGVLLVERAELAKALDEHQLGLSGIATPETSAQAGRLAGARVLVTGSVLEVDGSVVMVAKIIGAETGVVLGESVKGRKDEKLAPLVERLAGRIARKIEEGAARLVAPARKPADRIADLAARLGDDHRPSVTIQIAERHVGQRTMDPAAQTELMALLKATGFTVLTADAAAGPADVLLRGEGMSELLGRRGELVSVRARVEVQAVDRVSGRVLAVDRQTTVVVDLAEQLAGKAALEQAAAGIAERLLPKLVRKKG